MTHTAFNAIWLVCMLLTSSVLYAQNIPIHGTVKDGSSGEGLPFAAVTLKNTPSHGTTTDIDGNFQLKINQQQCTDSLTVQYMGYKTKHITISSNGAKIAITLSPAVQYLNEIVVRPGENPAFEIIRKSLSIQQTQTPSTSSWESLRTTQIVWQLEKMDDMALYRPFLANAAKVTGVDSLSTIPIFASHEETLREGTDSNGIVTTLISSEKKALAFDQEGAFGRIISDSAFLIDNVFTNSISIVDKSVPSPLSNHWRQNYRMTLQSKTTQVGGVDCHLIRFEPLIATSLSFTGNMWMSTEDSALIRIDMKLTDNQSTNFLKGFHFLQEWQKNAVGTYQSTYTRYGHKITGLPMSPDITAYCEIWDEPAHTPNTTPTEPLPYKKPGQQQNMVALVEQLEKNSSAGKVAYFANTLGTGYLRYPQWNMGHMLSLLMYNDIEGLRLGFGGTTDQLGKGKVYGQAYGGYGFKDGRTKYNITLKYLINTQKRQILSVGSYYDLLSLSIINQEAAPTALSLRLSQLGQLSGSNPFYQQKTYARYTHSLHPDLRLSVTAAHETLEQALPPNTDAALLTPQKLSAIKGDIQLRWVHQDRSGYNVNYRLQYRGPQRFPVVTLGYTSALIQQAEETLPYQKAYLNIQSRYTPILPGGETSYRIRAGKILGKAPYPYLKVHKGNPGPFYLADYMQVMNRFEFVSDQYAELYIQHLFNGSLMGLIPGLKWIHQKTTASFLADVNVVWGSLSEENQRYNQQYTEKGMPVFNTLQPSLPLIGCGYGIENIFKIAFVQVWHRLTYTDTPYPTKNTHIKSGIIFRL